MADAARGLTYVLDENWAGIPALLRQARSVNFEAVTTLEELGIPAGTLDPDVLRAVGRVEQAVLLTRDGSMLQPVLQRGAWQEAGVTLFLFGKGWGQLRLGELARRVLFLWPGIVAHAVASAPGTAWRVNPTVPSRPANSFRLVTGRHAGS